LIILFGVLSYVLILVLRVLLTFEKLTRRPNHNYVTVYVGCIATALTHTTEVSRCYSVNNERHCFYTNGSLLSWDDAKDFSEAKNSTLPIITDENIDNVFQRFIDDDSSGVARNSSVWLGARARPVNESDWHWIDRHMSGIYTRSAAK